MWKEFAFLVICLLQYSTATQEDVQCYEVVKGAIQNCFARLDEHETIKKNIKNLENICENVNKIIPCVTSSKTLTQDAQDDVHRKCLIDSSRKYRKLVWGIQIIAGIRDFNDTKDCPKVIKNANENLNSNFPKNNGVKSESSSINEEKSESGPSGPDNAENLLKSEVGNKHKNTESSSTVKKRGNDDSSREIKKEPIQNANKNLNSNSPKNNEVKSESSSINKEKSESGSSGPDSAENLLKSLNAVENKHKRTESSKRGNDDSSREIKKERIQNSNENLKNNEVKSDSSSINKEKSESGKNKNSSGPESAENLLKSLNEEENKHEYVSAVPVQKQRMDDSSGKSNTGDKEKYKENLKKFNALFLNNKVPSESNVENEESSGAAETVEANENGEESSGATEEGDANENGDNMSKAEKNLFLFNQLAGERKKTKQYGKYKEW